MQQTSNTLETPHKLNTYNTTAFLLESEGLQLKLDCVIVHSGQKVGHGACILGISEATERPTSLIRILIPTIL